MLFREFVNARQFDFAVIKFILESMDTHIPGEEDELDQEKYNEALMKDLDRQWQKLKQEVFGDHNFEQVLMSKRHFIIKHTESG